jgi:hypothetical protein
MICPVYCAVGSDTLLEGQPLSFQLVAILYPSVISFSFGTGDRRSMMADNMNPKPKMSNVSFMLIQLPNMPPANAPIGINPLDINRLLAFTLPNK